MKGLNQVLVDGGGETYVDWPPRVVVLWEGGGFTCVKEEVDEHDDADEQEENTDSLSD
jgi:hypothetical protein